MVQASTESIVGTFFTINAKKLHELRMDVMNKRQLSGLYEAMLQTSQVELCDALQEITMFLEQKIHYDKDDDTNANAVVVHCVQGKDRTGIVIMICQSMMGLSEEEMLRDYYLSYLYRINKNNQRRLNLPSFFTIKYKTDKK